MKTFIKVLITAYVLLLVGCERSRNCKGNALKGDIITVYELNPCYELGSIWIKSGNLITDTFSYKRHITVQNRYDGKCFPDTVTDIGIDFSKYSLIGKQTFSACKGRTQKNVVVDRVAKTIEYTITITICKSRSCSKTYLSNNNLVIIPKVNNKYILKTKIIEQNL